jgi:hypothetical protein
MRNATVLGMMVLSGVAIVGAAACGGGSSSSAGTSDGGTSGGGAPSSAGGAFDPNRCEDTGPGGEDKCKNGELEAYAQCVNSKCDSQYQKCFGPNYKTGSFSGGDCSTYFTCTNACACDDTACMQKCGVADPKCRACLATFQQCSAGCQLPACAMDGSGGQTSGGGSVGNKTCADLKDCCASLTDADQKEACEQASTALTMDVQCSAAYAGFCS